MQGGAEHQVALLASGLAGRGWRVSVVSMRPPEAHVEMLRQAGVVVESLGMRRRLPDPRGIQRLAHHIRRWRPDLVHSHMVHANLLARATRPFAPMPVLISTAHNINEGPRWRELAYRLTDSLADLTTNVSTAATEQYVRVGAVPARKIRHVPNGIDLTRFQRDPELGARTRRQLGLEQRTVLLAVGRFEEAKDHFTLLTALRDVVRDHSDVVLLLVGAGSLEQSTRQHADRLGLADAVRFLGIRTDTPALMNAADAYVMASRWEGLPLVLLEAAAVGLPIVATDVGGNRDIVHDGKNGLLVPPGNPLALASGLRQVLGMAQSERVQWGEAGRAIVHRDYDIERVLDRWEEVYRELWSRRRQH
jgi:glycosyltransferase involved in cell wall biosynthesis